ncbi:MAG: hypothetical protein NT170_03780 [Candidatus Moranbacteria bacterium]|nr:hypothetical protein [Candidatus Moranbacteria bacterium]
MTTGNSGTTMCGSVDATTMWPSVAANTCTEGTTLHYTVTSAGGGSGSFTYSVPCTINGTVHTTTCTETSCSTT